MSDLPRLVVEELHATVAGGQEILRGVNLTVSAGEVVAVMGPNGSGKSTLGHVLMGREGYEVTGGSVRLDGEEIVGMPTYERARRGLFLALQYPIEVPGVRLSRAMAGSTTLAARTVGDIATEAARVGLGEKFVDHPLNVDMSGGEKKRNEILQMGVLRPRIAILDEIDSGLDVDGLRIIARRVFDAATDWGVGVLAITHYNRLLEELHPTSVHVLAHGRIVDSGGPELAMALEDAGYARYQ